MVMMSSSKLIKMGWCRTIHKQGMGYPYKGGREDVALVRRMALRRVALRRMPRRRVAVTKSTAERCGERRGMRY